MTRPLRRRLPAGARCLWSTCRRPLWSRHDVGPIPPGAVRHAGRGLCTHHYDRAAELDILPDFPRLTRSYDDTLDDWDLLRRGGATRTEGAEKIGITVKALDKAIDRGRAAGDPRAVSAPLTRSPVAVALHEFAARRRREAEHAARRAGSAR